MSTPSFFSRLISPLTGYTHWLHTRWPAGTVERLPEVGSEGVTRLPGVRVVGDLTGIPLLKFSADSGARAVQSLLQEPDFKPGAADGKNGYAADMLDLAILGGGVSGIAAALEAKKAGLRFQVFEAAEPFSTIVNFPKAKPIYTYPTAMTPAGDMQFRADIKETLLDDLQSQRQQAGIEIAAARADRIEAQADGSLLIHFSDDVPAARARRIIVAIGRSGDYRRLGMPGEELDKVANRLHDPKDFAGKNVLVVGGGDSALETAIALGMSGAHVTLSYRKKEFNRPKPENVEKLRALERDPAARVQVERPKSSQTNTAATLATRGDHPPGSVALALGSQVVRIESESVSLKDETGERSLPNDAVFTMIGREAPLGFFRRSGLPIRNEWTPARVLACLAFVAFCFLFYHWKKNDPTPEFTIGGKSLHQIAEERRLLPFNLPDMLERSGGALAEWSRHEGNLLYTLKRAIGDPSWYYGLLYSALVLVFGIRRIRRRRTPYVTRQTIVLMAIQIIPLCILSDIVLPWIGRNGWFEQGHSLRWIADQLFESYDGPLGHERAYWRVCGFILAWPLFVYNVFTDHPSWMWLGISLVQTFVIIPWMVWRWGKGAYCGWICSCGALAETLGDAHRHKMPHGPGWNRLNMAGQAILAFAFALLGLRVAGWAMGEHSAPAVWFKKGLDSIPYLNWAWSVDVFLGGVLGVGLYFWFSGRTWCRFFCPLAALMHIYARFSRFRIFPDKSKCISCNVCTSVCHQGIDVMSFANKGAPMADPQCVRCSACVQECPTGVLSFGRYGGSGEDGEREILLDRLPASPVLMREHNGANSAK